MWLEKWSLETFVISFIKASRYHYWQKVFSCACPFLLGRSSLAVLIRWNLNCAIRGKKEEKFFRTFWKSTRKCKTISFSLLGERARVLREAPSHGALHSTARALGTPELGLPLCHLQASSHELLRSPRAPMLCHWTFLPKALRSWLGAQALAPKSACTAHSSKIHPKEDTGPGLHIWNGSWRQALYVTDLWIKGRGILAAGVAHLPSSSPQSF